MKVVFFGNMMEKICVGDLTCAGFVGLRAASLMMKAIRG
jgi:hypothetical protein